MRRRSLLAAGIAVAATTLAGAPATAMPAPSLLVSTPPLVVSGLHFRPLERVRVEAVVGGIRLTRVVRSTRAGAFRAAFTARYDPCVETLRVSATGVRGDRAVEKLPQRACPPPP